MNRLNNKNFSLADLLHMWHQNHDKRLWKILLYKANKKLYTVNTYKKYQVLSEIDKTLIRDILAGVDEDEVIQHIKMEE